MPPTDNSSELSLLEKTQKMVEVERALTATMEKVEPWLNTRSNVNPNHPRVRPIPTNMEEVNQVLAVARNLASRTSAPAGWNPNAPVVGFTTPSPLPHQLRGGALAALQLEQAKQAERDKKRLKMERQQQLAESQKTASEAAASTAKSTDQEEDSETARDPKRREIVHHEHEIVRSKSDIERSVHEKQMAKRRPSLQQPAPPPPPPNVDMNLSESSSEEEED